MSTQNKFTTTEEFLEAVARQFSCSIDKESFLKLGIKKKSDGFYHTSQFFEIKDKIDEKELSEIVKPISISDYEKAKHIMNPEFPIISFDMLEQAGRTAKIEAYNFSLLLFTKEFQKFINEVRQAFNIPPSATPTFDRVKHFKKLAADWYKLGLLKSASDSNKVASALYFTIETGLSKHTDYQKKSYKKRSLLFSIVYDYIISNDPFKSTAFIDPKSNRKRKALYRTKTPILPKTLLDDNIEINIVVYYETTKEEVKDAIDSVWESIEACKKRLPSALQIERVKNIESLKIKWQVYHLHKIKRKTHKEISILLKLSEENSRKIVSETKKEILKLKDGKLLP